MNTIYEVTDYLINLSDYKTDHIQDLFKFNDKIQIVKLLTHQKIWKAIISKDYEGQNFIIEPGFSFKEPPTNLPNGICLLEKQNIECNQKWNLLPIDSIEPYYNLQNYTITRSQAMELLKIPIFEYPIETIFQKTFDIYYSNFDYVNGSFSKKIYTKRCLSLFDILKENDVPRNLYYNFSSKLYELILDEIKIEKTRGENGEIVCRLPLPETKSDEELPYVSIVTPTYNRSNFWELMYSNFKRTDYPKERLEWVIVDDSPMNTRLKPFIVDDPRIKYYYIKTKKRLSIGKKRNLCAQYASHKYIVHMDDDDYYENCSVLSRIKSLLVQNKRCIGSTELVCYDLLNGVECYAYDESIEGGPGTMSEASMAYTKDFWEEGKFDTNVSSAESVSFIRGRETDVTVLNGPFIVVGLTHGKNTVVRQKQIVQNLKEPFLDRIPVKVSNLLKNITVRFLRNKKGFEEILQTTTRLEKGKANRFEKVYNNTKKEIRRHPFFRQRIHPMMTKKTVKQLVILYHPKNTFSFYSDNEDIFKIVWKKGVCENKLFYHKPEVNFLIDFVHEISKEREVIVYCPCEGTIKISKNLTFLPWYYFNVYKEYNDFISWNYFHFEGYKLKIRNPILFLTDKVYPSPESLKSFNKVIVHNEEFEWELKCHLSDFGDYSETIEYGVKSYYFHKNKNDCVCITSDLRQLKLVVRMFKFLSSEYPEKKLTWIGDVDKKELMKLKQLYDFKIITNEEKKIIYNTVGQSQYMIVPSENGVWESLLGVSHGCKVITLSKIKPFDTKVFMLKDNESIYSLEKYRQWIEDIKKEWNCKTDLNFKKQIQKIIQTNSIRNITKQWKNVLNF